MIYLSYPTASSAYNAPYSSMASGMMQGFPGFYPGGFGGGFSGGFPMYAMMPSLFGGFGFGGFNPAFGNAFGSTGSAPFVFTTNGLLGPTGFVDINGVPREGVDQPFETDPFEKTPLTRSGDFLSTKNILTTTDNFAGKIGTISSPNPFQAPTVYFDPNPNAENVLDVSNNQVNRIFGSDVTNLFPGINNVQIPSVQLSSGLSVPDLGPEPSALLIHMGTTAFSNSISLGGSQGVQPYSGAMWGDLGGLLNQVFQM